MADDQIVNEEQTSEEETTSTEAEKVEQPQEQPFTDVQKATIQQLIAEQAEANKEAGRREMQGVKDREVAKAQGRARFAEDSLARVRTKYADLDPETKATLEADDLKAQIGYYQTQETQNAQRQEAMAIIGAFEGNMAQFITDMGIDPKDKRVDWGDRNSMNLTQRQAQILKSVTKIHGENTKVSKDKANEDFKTLESNLRKELGLDSHDTTPAAGAGGKTEKEKLKERYPTM